MKEQVSTVFVTFPDENTARMICRELVERRLAACANIFPVGSIYRWKGKIEEASEHAAVFKIQSADFRAVVEAIKQLHPYEVPCIVRYEIAEGSGDYISWVIGSTARPP